MTKSTWKNIYNFNTTESNFDINDIISSVSDTTDFERRIKNNLNNMDGGNIIKTNLNNIPLVYHMENQQNGGSNENINEDSISTEQLENKLRSIFTSAEKEIPQNGGGCENDDDGNPIPHLKVDENIPLIMATHYSDATSISNIKNSVVDSSSSSTSESNAQINTSQASGLSTSPTLDNNNQVNLIQATHYSDATSFSNSH